MLKKDNIKINFNKFEEEFKVENIEDMYVGTGEYKGSIEYALFIKCSDGLYQFIIKCGWQIHNTNEILRRMKTGIDIKFETYEQYGELVKQVMNNLKNR